MTDKTKPEVPVAGVDELRAAAAAALEAKAAGMPEEQRATYREKSQAIAQAIADSADGGQLDVWLQDFDDATAFYYSGCDTFQVPYTLADDGTVTLGTPVEVEAVVTYEPVSDADDRSAAVLERRRRKAEGLGGMEHRSMPADGLEVRENGDGSLVLTGYASVTGRPYPVGDFMETIEPGAFKRTLSENPDVQLLINHTGMPIARTKSGTMDLEEDHRGLRVTARLDPLDPDVISLQRKMARGDMDEMSFAFQQTSQSWDEDYTRRSIKACSIHKGDCSIVNFGANDASTASFRDLVSAFEQRAGKKHSAETIDELKAARDRLDALIGDREEPAEPVAAEAERAAEPVVDAKPTPRPLMPDYLPRARERLALIQRGRHA